MRRCQHICPGSKKKLKKNKTGSELFFSFGLKVKKNNSDPILRAFTLVEVLITAAIFSVVSIAIYATFNSGMTVWRRAQSANIEDRKLILKIEKIGRELRQAFISNDIVFKADKNKVQFSSVIDSEIWRIIYSFDENSKILLRSSDKLAEILAGEKKELEPKFVSYISDIDKLSLSYLIFDLQKNSYIWKEEWPQNTLPVAIKFNITIKDKTYASTIIIPTA